MEPRDVQGGSGCSEAATPRSSTDRSQDRRHPQDHHRSSRGTGANTRPHWHVRVDEARFIHTGDQQYMLVGTPEVLVDKATGEVTTLAYLSAPALFADMTTAHERLGHPGSRGR